jgi:hypothetical protein
MLLGSFEATKMSNEKIDKNAVAIVEIVKAMSNDDLGQIVTDSVKWQLDEYPAMPKRELMDNMIDEIIMSIEQSDEGSRYYITRDNS